MNLFNYLMNKKNKKIVDNNHVFEYLLSNQEPIIREKSRIIDGENINILIKNLNNVDSTTATNDISIEKIIFDFWNRSYETLLGNFDTGTDVSYNNDGSIRLFYNNATVYILSNDIISILNASSMFRAFKVLEEVDFINFDMSENTSLELFMFESNSLYKQQGMENFDTSNVTTMQNMLNSVKFDKIGQDNTCDLNVSNWNTENVTNMRQMFRRCEATYIDISNFRTPKCSIFKSMFANCTNLITLNMQNVDMSLCNGRDSGNTNASEIVEYCPNLTNLIFSKNLGNGYTNNLYLYPASINLSASPLLTKESILSVFNNIGIITSSPIQYPLIYMGNTNYNKLTQQERNIAINKNWQVTFQSRN